MATRGEGNQRLRPMTERCEHGIPAAVDGHFYAGIGENFSGADLNHANLTGADLTRANLACTDLDGANLTGSNLMDADLRNVKQEGVMGADLSDAYLHDVDLSDDYAIGAEEVETRPKPNDNHYY